MAGRKKHTTTYRHGDVAVRFLTELSRTLDIKKTIDSLGMTETEASDMFAGLAVRISIGGDVEAQPESPADFTQTEKAELRTPSGKCPAVVVINVDGASRGNPGPAGAGALIADTGGRPVRKLRKFLGTATNNFAEYSALIIALEAASTMGAEEVRVHADSELMVKQVNGVYRVKSPDLKPLYDQVMSLLKHFRKYKVSHVYRDKNAEADRLANEAIDGPKG